MGQAWAAVEVDPLDPSHLLGDLQWAAYSPLVLPTSIADLTIDGDLCLQQCGLTSLPETFGEIRIGGSLYLNGNELETLPDSFGSLVLAGSLNLSDNALASLPDSIGHLSVGDDLVLSGNRLESLPASFSHISVGGQVGLWDNPVAEDMRVMRSLKSDELLFPGLHFVLEAPSDEEDLTSYGSGGDVGEDIDPWLGLDSEDEAEFIELALRNELRGSRFEAMQR